MMPLPLENVTPRRRRGGLGLVVAFLLATAAVLASVALLADQPAAKERPGRTWADVQVAQLQQTAAVAAFAIEQAHELGLQRRRIDQLCATLDVLVGMTAGRARLPRVVEGACDPPLAARTGLMLWGPR